MSRQFSNVYFISTFASAGQMVGVNGEWNATDAPDPRGFVIEYSPWPPSEPSNLVLTSGPGSALTLTWDAPANNGAPITLYKIESVNVMDHAGQTRFDVLTTNSTTNSTIITLGHGLQVGRGYAFMVTAINSAGEGDRSRPPSNYAVVPGNELVCCLLIVLRPGAPLIDTGPELFVGWPIAAGGAHACAALQNGQPLHHPPALTLLLRHGCVLGH